jgi:hypothetical protein
MENDSKKPGNVQAVKQLRGVFHPKNLLKTVASQVPIASAGVEVLNQLEGQRVDQRITALELGNIDGQLVEKRISSLEEAEASLLAQMQALEKSAGPATPAGLNEWPVAVQEFKRRGVEFAVVHKPDGGDKEFVLAVANGCLVGDDCVLTCSEALELAYDVAAHKGGRVVIMFGLCWSEFEEEPADEHSGLILCKITKRDEAKFERSQALFKKHGVDLNQDHPIKKAPKSSITPWLGQEVGFIIASEAKDNMREDEYTRVEFGTSVISYFKKPTETVFKVFVTAVFSSRISQAGSAVFSRDGTLLGVLSGIERTKYDTGRRAVVKSLLGVPRYMEEHKRKQKK